MRSLGVDLGGKRTGLAISDPTGVIAFPLDTIVCQDRQVILEKIAGIAAQYQVKYIVVGVPYSMDGRVREQAQKAQNFAEKLSLRTEAEVKIWDEHLSTVVAEQLLTEAGVKGDNKKQKLDAAAAAGILQRFLDSLQP